MPAAEAGSPETELERWVRENQLDDCPFCPENWPNLYMMYMMALPIHIGPYGMGRGDAMTATSLPVDLGRRLIST